MFKFVNGMFSFCQSFEERLAPYPSNDMCMGWRYEAILIQYILAIMVTFLTLELQYPSRTSPSVEGHLIGSKEMST